MNSTRLGAVMAFLGVAAGAFGAHGLRSRVDAALLVVFETGVRYHLVHALALLVLAALPLTPRSMRVATWAFLTGIVLFSGSLYVLALTNEKSLGAITPFGGTAFLIGWIAVAVGAKQNRGRASPSGP